MKRSDELDSDGDGIYDCLELTGIRISTGMTVTTDPYKADTDGDGLSDGTEIGINYTLGAVTVKNENGNPVKAVFYKAKSDPTKVDSDGDGYNDNGRNNDGIFADPRPLVGDVRVYKIKDSDKYVAIEDEKTGIVYYGGNQTWYEESNPGFLETAYILNNDGCGVVAATNLLLYFASNDESWNTELVKKYSADISIYNFNKDDFKEFTLLMEMLYFDIDMVDLDYDGIKETPHSVKGHYMTVTEIIEDKIANNIWLKSQTWGRYYYINYDEWINNCGWEVFNVILSWN